MSDHSDTPAADNEPTPTTTPVTQPERSRAPRALAITGIVLAGVLGLGLAFAGGVAVGRILPDQRGPSAVEVRGPGGDRGGQVQERIEQRTEQRLDERLDERRDERGERRDERFDERRELFEQWLEEQGIDPNPPAEPTE